MQKRIINRLLFCAGLYILLNCENDYNFTSEVFMETKDFMEKPVRKLFFHYLIPSIMGTMVTSIYVLADTIMIGKGMGSVAMAALNIALPIYNIFFGLGLLFGVGGSVLMSVFRGRGEKEKADAYFTAAFLMNLVLWLLLLGVSVMFMEEIAWMLGGTEETMPYIMEYIPYIIWGMGAYFLSSFLQTFVRNDGAPNLAMNGVIAGGVANIVLDYVFIFPMKMGMAGAALATVIGSYLTVGILLAHFFSGKNQLKFNLRGIRLRYLKEILVNGFASFLIEISSGITIFIFNLQLLKYVGNTGVTVFGIICNTAIVVMCLCKGVNQAAQPIISINYGGRKFDRTYEVRRLGMVTSLGICAVVVFLGLLVPDFFTYIFLNPDKEILAMSGDAIRIYFVGFLVMAVNMVYICYFQAVVKNGYSLLICLLRGCILVIGLVYSLPHVLGVNGIWLAFPIAEILTMGVGIFLTAKKS